MSHLLSHIHTKKVPGEIRYGSLCSESFLSAPALHQAKNCTIRGNNQCFLHARGSLALTKNVSLGLLVAGAHPGVHITFA